MEQYQTTMEPDGYIDSPKNKKFELLENDTIKFLGRTLYRIKALKCFSDVKIRDLGGYVEREENLSHDNDAWIYNNARVYDDARVYGNAKIYDKARVYDEAHVYENAKIYNNVIVCNNAHVYGRAWVYGDAWVYDNAHICGDTFVCGEAWICGEAVLKERQDLISFNPIGPENECLTIFKTKNNDIYCSLDGFKATLSEFQKAITDKHGDDKYAKQYKCAIELAKLRYGIDNEVK